MESDTGEQFSAKGFEANLIRDWNLDVEAHQRHNVRAIRAGRKPSRLVHNVIFSMPAGTPPEKVLKGAADQTICPRSKGGSPRAVGLCCQSAPEG
jgi:hypothetical protein